MTGTADTAPRVNKTQSNYKAYVANLKAKANGQWPSIFAYCRMPSSSFTGKPKQHVDCPMPNHGGAKDFRFDNKNGDGSYICSCSSGADGFNAIATFHGISNKDAIKVVAEYFEQHSTTNQSSYTPPKEKPKEPNDEKPLAKRRAGYHADKILSICEPKTHPYLQEKGIDDHALVITRNYKVNDTQTIYAGALIVKIYDVDNPSVLIGVQFINPDGKRFYVKDTKIEDGIHIIEGDSSLPYIDVVEGYASGVSANMVTGATTIVAFDTNGVKGKAERIKQLFSGKQLRFLGDNDSHKRWAGNQAAHTAALKTGGLVAIPTVSGKDWDNQRKENGIETTQAEINNQIGEYNKSIQVNERITGLSITSSIYLPTENKAVSFDDALINYTGKHCICPVSGNKAIINAGVIYCYETKQFITPIIASLYDADLLAKYKKLTSTKKRIKELSENPDQKNVYAFTTTLSHRIGADIPAEFFREWLHFKSNVIASEEIINFIKCLRRARINQSKRLIELNPKKFKNHLHLKQKNGLLYWPPSIEKIKAGRYRMVAVKAHHGQGKSQDFMKQMFNHAVSLGGATAIAHRTKLVTQLADVLKGIHYQDDAEYISYAGIVKDLACCLHSFKHEKFLNHLTSSHSIFIDEASQALKAFYTDPNIEEGLAKKFSEAAKKAQCTYLLDADLTENDIHRWANLLGINEDEILVITAEPPARNFTVNLTCTASLKYFKTTVIEAIEKDLMSNTPCVLAVEALSTARSIHKYFNERFPDKKIRLLHGKLPKGEIDPVIKNIQAEMATTDLLIHTSVIGTGVSIQHKDKRFKKGYGLFTGSILSATECLQMLRRCRDITSWSVTLLCRPSEMFMTSFYKDIGSLELAKALPLDDIKSSVLMEREQNKSLFIHAFRNLLEEYRFKVIEEFDLPEYEIDGLVSSSELNEEDIKELISATPYSLDKAEKAAKRGYKDREEKLSSESVLLANFYKTSRIGIEEAELECIPSLKHSARKMELLVSLLRGDKGESVRGLLNRAGISLDLFKKQRFTQEQIKALRDSIASKCAELWRLGLLKERYAKAEKIPEETPIKFIKEVLVSWGLVVETVETRRNDRERQLDINVPAPLARRLNLDAKTDKEALIEKVLELRENMSLGDIAKKLGIEKWKVQRMIGS
jgi:phage/plasmid primase-like uncharacterized protein